MSTEFAHYGLDAAIEDAARKAFAAAIAENADHAFFAFALTTLHARQYVECSLNSDINLEQILATAGSLEDDMRSYYKWYPNEWGDFEYFGQREQDFFAPVQELLTRIESETDARALVACGLTEVPYEPDHPRYEAFWKFNEQRRHYVAEMMILALKNLDEAGCFGDGDARRDRIILVDSYDDEDAEELRSRSIDVLNFGRASPALIQECLHAGQQ